MTTPQPQDLFLQVFSQKLEVSEDTFCYTMRKTHWGELWQGCVEVCEAIKAAQALADAATAVAEKTPVDWTPADSVTDE